MSPFTKHRIGIPAVSVGTCCLATGHKSLVRRIAATTLGTSIELTMHRTRWALVLIFCTALLHAGTPGSFRGTIVDAPAAATDKNWIYVQGRNGSARRVEVSHAQIDYDDSVPPSGRARTPQQALVVGAEVRVTAEQGSDGEWKATRIEILPASATDRSKPSSTVLKPL